jgi:hypothetical protein
MNYSIRNLLMTLALLGVPLGLHASTRPTALTDQELAGIKGGFCVLEKCEDPPGSGLCQPFHPDSTTICALTTCFFSQEIEGSVTVNNCNYLGPITCTEATTYRQCVLAFTQSSCFDGPVGPCGFVFSSHCYPNVPGVFARADLRMNLATGPTVSRGRDLTNHEKTTDCFMVRDLGHFHLQS